MGKRGPKPGPPKFCDVEGCGKRYSACGLCAMHYYRQRKYGTTDSSALHHRWGAREAFLDKAGYRVIKVDGRDRPEHRLLMEAVLGRPLTDRETVHHLNGVRSDNRLENLELWARPQPNGQRVADLVAWVVEHYPNEVRELLEQSTEGQVA